MSVKCPEDGGRKEGHARASSSSSLSPLGLFRLSAPCFLMLHFAGEEEPLLQITRCALGKKNGDLIHDISVSLGLSLHIRGFRVVLVCCDSLRSFI